MPQTILIVEDETDLAAIVADYVRASGYEADIVDDGARALEQIRAQNYDLVVLDLMLPALDGLSVCKAVRDFSDVPIIMVTAKVQEVDRLLGLDIGADDYVCKPFSPRELIARIKAVLRRRPNGAATPDTAPAMLQIDPVLRRVQLHGQTLELTTTEFNLLSIMAQRPGQIYSRAQLLDAIRQDALDITDRAIDSHIKNLRRKIAELLPEAEVIQSVYGVGYRVEM